MRRNPLVAVGVAALVGLLFWIFILAPRGNEIRDLNGQISSAEGELDALNGQLASLESIDGAALQRELAIYRGMIPPTPDEKGMIEILLAAADRANVSLDGFQFGSPSPASAAPVSAITVTFTVEGGYFDLARFLFELEHLERLAIVRSISVVPGVGGLSLPLTVELYSTDISAGPGSDPAPGPEVGA